MKPGTGSVVLGLAGLTLASRLLGFGRSLVFSKTVGDTCLGDVYNAANALPNVLFEVVAGGVLAGVVVPVVARHVAAGRTEHTSRTVSALITWTLLALTPAGVAAFAGAGAYASAFAKADCAGSAEVLAALLLTFLPQIWLYGLAVVSAGALQAHHRFVAAALAPLLSSVVVISAYLGYAALAPRTAGTDLDQLTRGSLAALGWGTTLGVLALAVTTAVPLARSGLALRPRLRFAEGDRAVILSLGLAGLVGLVLQQASVLVVNWSAQQTADPGALTRFTWANAIYLLPYAVLAAPLLQLAFPRLASAAERGPQQVSEVLGEVVPTLLAAAWLGSALLVATAVPVARVFVLGPGSGNAAALAAPIAAFAPAVVGFAMLGLASRALLAQHRARPAGAATAVAWGVVIGGALAVRQLFPAAWLVPGLAASVSLGMISGAVIGWIGLHRDLDTPPHLTRPALVSVAAAVPAAVCGGAVGSLFGDAPLVIAVLGAMAAAALCAVVFLGVLRLVSPELVSRLVQLRRRSVPVGPAAGDEG